MYSRWQNPFESCSTEALPTHCLEYARRLFDARPWGTEAGARQFAIDVGHLLQAVGERLSKLEDIRQQTSSPVARRHCG